MILRPRLWTPSRRHLLRTGVVGLQTAALSPILLPGCSSDDDAASPDAGSPDVASGDAGHDTTGPDRDTALGPDTSADDADTAPTDTVPAEVGDTPVAPPPRPFRIAIIADTHVIDEHYDGQESNELDTSSLYLAEERLLSVVDRINRLDPQPDLVFNLGDIIHDAEWTDWDYYFENRTRIDRAKEAHDRLAMPWHACLGNHDYRIGRIERQFSEDLFREKMGIAPWSAVDHGGWKFLLLNNFQGYTQDPGDDRYQRGRGTFGEEQLQWLEAQLAEGRPTFVFNHYMLGLCEDREFGDFSLHSLLRRHVDTIENVITGHTHRWLDFNHQFGPRHMVMGATRYDEDCFILAEIDPATDRVTYVNEAQWGMFSMYAEPYEGT